MGTAARSSAPSTRRSCLSASLTRKADWCRRLRGFEPLPPSHYGAQRRQHLGAGLGAVVARLRAHAAMPVHLGMPAAFLAAGAARRDADAELAFEHLTAGACFRTRNDRSRRQADRRAVEILADAGQQPFDVPLREAGIGASSASSSAGEAGLDTAAHRIRVGRPCRVRAQRGFNGGHRRSSLGTGSSEELWGATRSRPRWFRGNFFPSNGMELSADALPPRAGESGTRFPYERLLVARAKEGFMNRLSAFRSPRAAAVATFALMIGLATAILTSLAQAADEPDLIFKKSTVFHWVSRTTSSPPTG